jgi:hypothetical protein
MLKPKKRRSMRFSIYKLVNGRNNSRKWPSESSHIHLIRIDTDYFPARHPCSAVAEASLSMYLTTLLRQGIFATVAERKVNISLLRCHYHRLLTPPPRSLDPSVPD